MGCRSAFAAAVRAVLTATALIGPDAASPQGANPPAATASLAKATFAGGCFSHTTSCPG